MEKKHWKILAMAAVAAVWLVLAAYAWLKPADAFSDSERRELAQFPELSLDTVDNGQFMEAFESYTLDQFPLRDLFRQVKARFHYQILNQKDNNGIYLSQGYAAQLEYPLNESSVDHALAVFNNIRENYLSESKVYLAVVPDKGYYLAQSGGYPTMDYEALLKKMEQGMPGTNYVNLTDILTIDDYYRTDTHWRQERLQGVAQRLLAAMGADAATQQYSAEPASRPFYGVYYGQAALPMEPDTLYMLQSPELESCRVLNWETNKYGGIYDTAKLEGEDMYEVFLSGSVSLLTIENPNAATDRELIIFRDSFGSSLAPLLAAEYRTVTLVDVRYIASAMLGRFIDFHGQDVLFLYSTLVLNNSSQLQ